MTVDGESYIILNSTEYVEVAGISDIPAKIDTGADSSAIWASGIKMNPDGVLEFKLFDKKSPFYTGETLYFDDYKVKTIRSSHGDQQIRYQVKLEIALRGQTFETIFSLANRSRNNFPVLIGRRTLKNRFLVDVSKAKIKHSQNPSTPKLNQELKEDPYEFHQKYIERSK